MVKLSDYVFQFLKQKGVRHVFMLPGGGAMHLDDSIGRSGIEYICTLHEQAASVAAEAYAQHTNKIGVCLTTSGPGATNAITGVTAGWIDSTPMLVISGQAKRSDLIGETGVRQIGSQEVQIIDMVKPITKYAVQIMDPSRIRYHLERAYYEATSERPGPVWLSIPLDVQATEIEESELEGFQVPERDKTNLTEAIKKTIDLLRQSIKPVILAGNGIKLAGAEEVFYRLTEALQIPVLTTWKTIDMMGEEDPLYMGHPGSMGDRGANLVLQKADLLISIGSRLDTSLTAFNEPHFGMSAKKIVVDIDRHELDRMRLEQVELMLSCDAGDYIEALYDTVQEWEDSFSESKDLKKKRESWKNWLEYGHGLRRRYPSVTEEHRAVRGVVSAYYFIELLCKYTVKEDVIVPESSGVAGEITYQAFHPKRGQKMKNAAGLGSMGFGLPYAIGACLANGGDVRTVLINGDGAFQMNIQELQTVVRLNLPIKIFIWNNEGYASIRSMQNNNFGGFQVASGKSSGLTMPDIVKVAGAYGLKTFRIQDNAQLERRLEEVLNTEGPVLCELMISPDETVAPRTKTIIREDGTLESYPLEKMWPLVEVE